MGVLESLRVALDMLRLHKLRAFLTMLGVIIGVMSVSLIVLVRNGFQSYIQQSFEGIAADSIWVIFDPGERGRGETAGGITGLDGETRQFLMDRTETLRLITGVVQGPNQTARAGDLEATGVQVRGVDEFYSDLVRETLLSGRFITKADNEEMSNVAVVSDELAMKLFPNKNPIGRSVVMPGLTVEVVGVTETRRASLGPGQPEETMVVPLTTAQRKWLGGDNYTFFMALPKAGVPVATAMDDVWQTLMAKSGNKRLYRVESSESLMAVFQGVIGVAGLVLAAIAALSLLVGGIGIMNIMLVSVTERTREIGLRKAVGARRGAILWQFLIESALLSLVGGLIGMAIAWGLGQVVAEVTAQLKWPSETGLTAPFPIVSAFMAAGFSALIGVVFGFFPAVSAAKLDPIIALRRE